MFLVCGAGGVGKTHTVRAVGSAVNGNLLAGAMTGSAGSELFNGETLHSLLAFGVNRRPLGGSKYLQLRGNKLLEKQAQSRDVRVVVIDETSMLSAVALAHIKLTLDEIYDGRPFVLLLLGDNLQIDPVGHRAVYKDTVDRYILNPSTVLADTNEDLVAIGCRLYESASTFFLTRQMRAASDPHHQNMIDRIRRMMEKPVDDIFLEYLKMHEIKSEELSDIKLADAPVLVTTNFERRKVNEERLLYFAQLTGSVVFRWKLNARMSKKDCESIVENVILNTDDSGAEPIYQYFVKDLPSVLTENICVKLGISNGTFVRMNSLVFDVDELEDDEEEFIFPVTDRAAPGTIIDLPFNAP